MLSNKNKYFKRGLIFSVLSSMLFVTACGAGGAKPASKDDIKFPTRSIEGIVPWGAGGATDNVSRAIAAAAEKKLGQSITITNKPGATAALGTQYVYDKKADGYTLLFSAENPALYGVLRLSERSFEEFTPISILGRGFPTIVVPKDSKYNTLADVVNDAKANPLKVKMGSTGPGGLPFVVATMMKATSKAEFSMVPFDGDGPLLTALLGSHLDVAVVALAAAVENAKAGKVKVLAVVNDEKVKSLPDVPPISDAIPEMKKYLPWGPFYGVWVKKETPEAVKQKLVQAFTEAQQDAEYKKLLDNLGVLPMGITGEEADKFWRKWQSTTAWLLHDAGVTKAHPDEFKIPKN